MNLSLKNQVAVVTGSSSGIGAGVAQAMAKEGAAVVINYPYQKDRDKAQKVADEISASGGQAVLQMADISKENEVAGMFAAVIKQFGTVDILVNNAGIQKDAPFEKMTLDEWNGVMNVNQTGQFLCASEAIREFLRRGIVAERSCAAGKIICMSSVHQVIPWAGHANYAASKGGIMLLMKTLAQEFAPRKIRVNSIAPGAIKTNINRQAWDTPEAENKLLKLIPYDRVGEPADIGKVAVWLASDESDYVNGATLFVDGGMTLFPGFTTNG
jgi:glucose 1-dehydrogenase